MDKRYVLDLALEGFNVQLERCMKKDCNNCPYHELENCMIGVHISYEALVKFIHDNI